MTGQVKSFLDFIPDAYAIKLVSWPSWKLRSCEQGQKAAKIRQPGTGYSAARASQSVQVRAGKGRSECFTQGTSLSLWQISKKAYRQKMILFVPLWRFHSKSIDPLAFWPMARPKVHHNGVMSLSKTAHQLTLKGKRGSVWGGTFSSEGMSPGV